MSDIDLELEISKAHLAASGWNLVTHETGDPLGHGIDLFYIVDYRTGYSGIVCGNRVRFESMNVSFFESTSSVDTLELTSSIQMLLLQAARQPLDNKDQSLLVLLLILYIRRTQVYKNWSQNQKQDFNRMHSLVSVYGDQANGVLRPLIIDSKEVIIHVDDVRAAADRMKSIDAEKHPEWFSAFKHV